MHPNCLNHARPVEVRSILAQLMEGTSCSTIVYLHVSAEHLEHSAVGMLKCFQQLGELIRIGIRMTNHFAFYKTVPVYVFSYAELKIPIRFLLDVGWLVWV